ncbi:MAG: hypothetical protein ABIR84_10570 [Candidatus Nitrotoga sp.]
MASEGDFQRLLRVDTNRSLGMVAGKRFKHNANDAKPLPAIGAKLAATQLWQGYPDSHFRNRSFPA